METTEKKLLMFQMLKTKVEFGYCCGIFSKNDSLLAMYCSKSGSMLWWLNKLAARRLPNPAFYVGQEKLKINCSANIRPRLYTIFYTGKDTF